MTETVAILRTDQLHQQCPLLMPWTALRQGRSGDA